jgi:hypothetical protein
MVAVTQGVMLTNSHKLNGEIYIVWKHKMKSKLTYRDLWCIVTGRGQRPVNPAK